MNATWLSVNFERFIVSPHRAAQAVKQEFSTIRWSSFLEAGQPVVSFGTDIDQVAGPVLVLVCSGELL
jgi:hypothetical protein